MAKSQQLSTKKQTFDNKFEDIIASSLTTLWENKYVRFALAFGTILTARKILDVVRRKWYRLPPGPVGIPFLGTLNEFGNDKKQKTARQRYGPIFMYNIGLTTTVIINDYQLLSQLFRTKEFTDKLVPRSTKVRAFSALSVAEGWEERRKLMIHNLISPLNGKILSTLIENAMKQHIFPQIDKLSADNKTWFIRDDMKYLTFVTIYGSIFGEPYPLPNDKLLIEYRNLTNQFFGKLKLSFIFGMFLPSFIYRYVSIYILKLGTYLVEEYKIIEKWIEKYENNKKMRNDKNNNNENINNSNNINYYEIIKSSNLSSVDGISDMLISFTAGMHTTATALEQCILYLSKCGKEYQNELLNEITNMLNDNNNDTSDILSNVTKLPKLRSFIYEILRIHGTVGITLQRNITKDVEITVNDENDNGETRMKTYIIPKGARVYGNLHAINYDSNSQHWGNDFDTTKMDEFNPKRFFNEKTNEFIGKRQMSTFGSGRRNCAGQQLALRELFLVTSMLIQKYEFDIPEKCDGEPDLEIPKSFFGVNTPKRGVSVTLRSVNNVTALSMK